MSKDKQEVLVVGFPKSGNTWVARLLGEVLDSPVKGFESALPIATEGEHRRGNYVVRQLHLKPVYCAKERNFIASSNEANVENWQGEQVVIVQRDPRDVAVSAMYYWNISTLRETISAMYLGTTPFLGVGAYHEFVNAWMNVPKVPLHLVRYEMFIEYPYSYLAGLLSRMRIPFDDRGNITKAVDAQSFENKRNQILGEGSNDPPRPYGKFNQLKNMRKGIVGDWKNHFTQETGALMDGFFHDTMVNLGYLREDDNSWFLKLKQ